MRALRDNPIGAGQLSGLHNIKIVAKRIPAIIVHAAQTGIAGAPEGKRRQEYVPTRREIP
jgi:solute carrier family 20 (sodium-dependent phosphate transporter)